jgi:N-hydroxyarylamine O-acetyltransferase
LSNHSVPWRAIEESEFVLNTGAYLKRINYRGPLTVSAETLRALQLAHLLAVPFENLSIHANQPIVLDDRSLFDKIVLRRRGGFCYELNGLFAALLGSIGFNVTMLSAGVAREQGGFGPDFDHMTLMVTLEERWLADVGFGDSFCEPLLIDSRDEQQQDERAYRIDKDGDHLILMQRDRGEWAAQYRFSLQPHTYSDYEEMCLYHQTSPQSTFTQRRVCTRATADGRVTLSDLRLIKTLSGERQELLLADEDEYVAALREHFGVII